MAKVSKAQAAVSPWWVGEGDEECAHCGALYVLEVEFRCTQCDGPSCPHCKVKHVEGHFICPDCGRDEAHG